MKFTKVTLENFRGFAGMQTIPLHPELTVLVGVNGAGKSSVLDAMGSVLSGMVSWLGGKGAIWFAAGDVSNIHYGASEAFWAVDWSFDHGKKQAGMRAMATFQKDTSRKWMETAPKADFPPLTELRSSLADKSSIVPYLGYVHSSSTRHATMHPAKIELVGRLAAYKHAFDPESIQFEALSTWFEQEENLENQEKIRSGNLSRELPSLLSVRTAVQRFLGHLHGSKLGRLTVIRSHSADPLKPAAGRLAIQKSGHDLFIEQLSDGERRLILIVADTARRMVVLNPGMDDALETPGLLLLDEVELHLHPQWQRTVVGALRAAFPRLQFVIATHAPAVLATVPNECVVVLDGGQVRAGTAQVWGRDPNTILSTVMQTPLRPDDVQRSLDALYAEIDRSPRKANATLKKLSETLGSDDPDLVRAAALLQFMAG